MAKETKSGAQRAHSLRPRCIGAVGPRIRVSIYLSIYLPIYLCIYVSIYLFTYPSIIPLNGIFSELQMSMNQEQLNSHLLNLLL
jgi:hypothetical protein